MKRSSDCKGKISSSYQIESMKGQETVCSSFRRTIKKSSGENQEVNGRSSTDGLDDNIY